ncbi:hypothetical protein RJT34_29852 [Clitoria ternatea]|uniref:LysM domain receptor-like kinase 4 n=1 Tax=Clitoria ternatea TaxID=43366 RepID=A0AAN9I6S4_CLITE
MIESLVFVHKIMIHLWFVTLMCLNACYAQLDYDTNNCTSDEALRRSSYTCNSAQDSCRTFLVYRANKQFQTVSDVSKLFNKSSHELLLINNLTSSTQVLKQGKEVLLPFDCTCSGQYYQASLSYKVPENTTFPQIACGLFEGLLKHVTLAEENLPQGNKPEAGSELHVPLICACPDNFLRNKRVKYLVTYPIMLGDDSDKLSEKFGISPEDFSQANNLKTLSTIYPETVVLIPFSDGTPIIIHDIPDPPSPPPGFLPTNPVFMPEESTQPSNLYIAGSIIGFLFFITLLASGLYMKRLRKSDVVHSLTNPTNSPTLWSPTRSSPILTQTAKGSTRNSCLSPDLLAEIKYCLFNYSIDDLEKATENFSEENKIDDLVYKGLVNDLGVMIKRMRFEDTGQVIDLHSRINHINIVNLLGVCYGDESIVSSWSYLVFEWPKNGCLRDCLSDPSNPLNWYKRTQIAFDVATCLYYLHCCSFPSYAHMSVSSGNIFITANWRGKLADVGRALTTSATITKRNDGMEISKGLVAPEYLLHGSVSEKVDIFAFGVVLLELISGRDSFDGKSIKDSLGFLLGEASEGGCFEGLRSFMDPNLKDYSLPEALCLSFLAKDCVADDPLRRPTMDDIMKVLTKMV